LARLPGSRAEVLSIVKELKNVLETVTLLGEDANETGIKALNLSKFDILHFAVHGLLTLISPPDPLFFSDLVQMKLRTEFCRPGKSAVFN